MRALRRWHPAAWAALLVLSVGVTDAAPVSSRLVALRKANGAPLASLALWRTPEGVAGKPTVAGGWAYFVEEGKTLCGLNLTTGKVAWKTPLDAPTRFTPLAIGRLVLIYNAQTIAAYTGTTGRALWTLSTNDLGEEWMLGEKTKFAWGDDRLFICSPQALLGLDLEKGEPIWATRRKHAEDASPVVAGRFLYVRSFVDPKEWARYLVEDGSDAREEATFGPMDANPGGRAKKPMSSRVFVSSDRRSMTMLVGSRRVTYRAPEPFTISGVVGETAGVICVQLVAQSPVAAERG
jgi:outer membrane protein assembly factor BamB